MTYQEAWTSALKFDLFNSTLLPWGYICIKLSCSKLQSLEKTLNHVQNHIARLFFLKYMWGTKAEESRSLFVFADDLHTAIRVGHHSQVLVSGKYTLDLSLHCFQTAFFIVPQISTITKLKNVIYILDLKWDSLCLVIQMPCIK